MQVVPDRYAKANLPIAASKLNKICYLLVTPKKKTKTRIIRVKQPYQKHIFCFVFIVLKMYAEKREVIEIETFAANFVDKA